jgi:predicted PurR-regulated permease PerM
MNPVLVPARPAPDEFRIFRALLLFSLLLAAGWLAHASRAVLLPFFLGGVLAYVMGPLVTFLELRGLRRSTAVAVLFVAVTALAAGLIYWTVSIWWQEIPRLRYQWPLYIQQIKASAAQADAYLLLEAPWLADRLSVTEAVDGLLARSSGKGVPTEYLSHLGTLLLNLILVPFSAFFLLKGGRAGFQALLDACPGRWVEKFLSVLYRVDEVIGDYLRGVLTEAFLVASCAGVGLLLIGVDYAGLLAAVTLLFNIVPFVGPLLAGTLAVVAAFLQFGTFLPAAQTALLFLSLRLTDDFVFQPMVMNHAVHLHPALVVFSLLAGHEIAGVWGLLLAVPLVSIVKESVFVLADWYRSENGRHVVLPASLTRAISKPWVV